MLRQEAVKLLRSAGYHGNKNMLLAIYHVTRISYPVAVKEWHLGQNARLQGKKCDCKKCNRPVAAGIMIGI